MRRPPHQAELGRCLDTSDSSFGNNGAFQIPFSGRRLLVIASDGAGWDHVSVSLPDRCPTWDEMCFVKRIFWRDEEAVIQLHPPSSQYVNNHPFCLHLWRFQLEDVVLPPPFLVGIPPKEA